MSILKWVIKKFYPGLWECQKMTHFFICQYLWVVRVYMSNGTIILFNMNFLKLSNLSRSWVLSVTEILECLIPYFYNIIMAVVHFPFQSCPTVASSFPLLDCCVRIQLTALKLSFFCLEEKHWHLFCFFRKNCPMIIFLQKVNWSFWGYKKHCDELLHVYP